MSAPRAGPPARRGPSAPSHQAARLPVLFAGIAAVAMATLMQQIMLTRLFSVTLYYHYAFAIVSLTMLGMTMGALAVFLCRRRFASGGDLENLAFFSGCLGVFSAAGVLMVSSLPFLSLGTPASALGNFLIFLPSFTCSGVIVTLILTRHVREVSLLYAGDLCGAALGCIVTLVVLDIVGAINGLLLSSLLAALAGLGFARTTGDRGLERRAARLAVLLGVLASGNTLLAELRLPHLGVIYAKGALRPKPEFEEWNSYSRVTVSPYGLTQPFGWGLSARRDYRPLEQKALAIDAGAGSVIMQYRGDPAQVDFLRYDVTNAAYALRPVDSVAVIGVGGGRDVLSALTYGARRVVGIEMNRSILYALEHVYGDFAGHLGRMPGVTLVNDEARSYLTRSREKVDLVQVSLIDTWAATAAGAFALTENGLYTVEGWRVFYRILTDRGMLTLARWYDPLHYRGELYRMLALARTVLKDAGFVRPRDHVVVVEGERIATLILSRSPITAPELASLLAFVRDCGFRVVLAPGMVANEEAAGILEREGQVLRSGSVPLDISPPTDDRPFFFNMLSLSDGLRLIFAGRTVAGEMHDQAISPENLQAIETLLYVFFTVTALTVALVFLPLLRAGRLSSVRGNGAWLLYFGMIGLGFMFLEIAQMQRLMVFLGHPTYALAVVMFALLVASGGGSFASRPLRPEAAGWPFVALCAVLALLGVSMDGVLAHVRGAPDAVRIASALALLLPMGFFMGLCFPIGMKCAGAAGRLELTPWFWGVNGAMSVLASVLALVVAMCAGISASFWVGVACYAVAILTYFFGLRRGGAASGNGAWCPPGTAPPTSS